MSEMFGAVYADAYDLLYQDKDYDAECDLIESLFKNYGESGIKSVLDLGCGTGNHAVPLARRGYEVVGVDHSESMISIAEQKAAQLPGLNSISFHHGDIRNIDLHRQFHAVLMMFAVLGYQLENEDVLSALRTGRRHLTTGGLLIFDVWYGPAVLNQRPTQKIKVIPTQDGRILRVAGGELDVSRHLCAVNYHLLRLEGDRLVGETKESHLMRYFFPKELDLFLECAGFAPLRLGAFPRFHEEPGETSWNVLGVARAV